MISRRQFTQSLSALAVSASTGVLNAATEASSIEAAETDAARQIAPAKDSSPFRLGIIGAGSRGQELIRSFLRVPGVSVAAAADVYEPRFAQLNRICGHEVAPHKDYRALLDRKDLDAVIVATPLGLHGEHVVAALSSGHHVYGEKVMAYTVEQANAIVAAASENKRIYQIGHQYRYSPWIRAAVQRVQQGEIGDVTHIIGYWHRNNDWRRPVPDPSLEHLINWRLYHQWSLGLIAELGSHHMDIANWVFGEYPEAALASGSICRYHDGRETDDNVQAILSYSGGRRFIFTSITDNAKMGDQLWLYGTKGSLNLTLQDATFFYEPKKITKPVVAANGKDEGVVTSASYNPSNEMPYRGPGKPVDVSTAEDPTTAATRAFIYCVRTGTSPIADAKVGLGSALGVIQANESLRLRKEIPISSKA
ncbi:putative dehydrogenase [Granulicella aggregans]|uniref:Putative dehydrogenase n=1 Tax=Granulicella aggregans TaxID=474949 RepID=A0A7W7ZBS2_9BACT|nr:Gfo/Idh/MocA family oxidoreductase [Granulicella aggregans]MBB5056848.1 putative dehydrogenase [Granulicella aggregans]